MVRYDAAIIHEMADRLYASASLIEFAFTLTCALLGAAIGWWSIKDPGAVFLTGSVGAGLGYLVGHHISLRLRFQAQLALCQSEIAEMMRAQLHASQYLANHAASGMQRQA